MFVGRSAVKVGHKLSYAKHSQFLPRKICERPVSGDELRPLIGNRPAASLLHLRSSDRNAKLALRR